jgi:serine/threonine protein kinase
MEYCSRGALVRVLQEHPSLPLWRLWDLLRGAAKAMYALHTHAPTPIMHRDLKTANLLVTEDWVCKVCDFGLAKGVGTVSALTHAGCTPVYTAPEVLLDEEEFSLAADVYSFGVTLLEIASGEQPKKDDKNAIATGMMKWAMEKGSTQFAHWFSPIRGANGLKKDAFIGASRAVTSGAWPRPRRCGASTFSLSLVRRSHTSRSHPLFCPLSLCLSTYL